MREIYSSSGSPTTELDETVIATMPWPEPPEFQELRKKHPKSKFIWHVSSDTKRAPKADKQKDEADQPAASQFNRIGQDRRGNADTGLSELYKEVTILLTSDLLPLPGQAPNLKLVQLFSAGFDHLVEDPLFTGSDVAFATANGVHG